MNFLRNGLLRPWLILLGILIATAAIYALGVGGGYVFDDFPNIVDNAGVHPTSASLANLINAALSSPASDFKRPLASLSFALNYLFTGLDPLPMKVTNIAIHLLNGWLIFLLTRQLLAAARERQEGDDTTALWVTAAWLLAPINLTAVLYVVQRMESMANLAVLLGLLGYVSARSRMLAGKRGLIASAVALLASAGAGVLAKETAVMVVPYAFLIECFVFRWRRSDNAPRIDTRLVILYVVILAIPLLAGLAWLAPVLLKPETWSRRDFTLGTRLLTEPRIVTSYVSSILAPLPSSLPFYYDDVAISTSPWTPWTTLPAIVFIAGLAGASIYLRRRAPVVALGLAFFLMSHILTATVLPLELVYEHRNYFASYGLLLALVAVLRGASTRGIAHLRLARTTLLAAMVVFSGLVTAMTARAWNGNLSLAFELAHRAPDSPRAQYELGRTYIILSGYDASSPFTTRAYAPLKRAMSLPGSSILPEQALIFLNSRIGRPIDPAWWHSIRTKLQRRPATIQDESSLGSLVDCVHTGACKFQPADLLNAFVAALSQPNPSPRMLAMYASFAWNTLEDRPLGLTLQRDAIKKAPSEMAYHLTLGRMTVANGDLDAARAELAIIEANNLGGRLSDDVESLRDLISKRAGEPMPVPASTH
jgi:protein O-mannosyl-transferase